MPGGVLKRPASGGRARGVLCGPGRRGHEKRRQPREAVAEHPGRFRQRARGEPAMDEVVGFLPATVSRRLEEPSSLVSFGGVAPCLASKTGLPQLGNQTHRNIAVGPQWQVDPSADDFNRFAVALQEVGLHGARETGHADAQRSRPSGGLPGTSSPWRSPLPSAQRPERRLQFCHRAGVLQEVLCSGAPSDIWRPHAGIAHPG